MSQDEKMTAPGPPLPPAGWYPTNDGSGTERWWDGSQWLGHPRPIQAGDTPDGRAATLGITLGAIAVLIGSALQFQSVSLITGAGTLWLGAALTLGGAIAIFACKGQDLVRLLAVLALIFCVANVVRAEHQLNDRRHQIQQIFHSP